MSRKFDYYFKVSIIGDPGAGKSNFLKRLSLTLTYDWDNTEKPTIGVDISIFHSSVYDHKVKLLIWDTAGHPRFRGMILKRLRGSHGFFVVYDITDRKTFENVRNWVKDAKEYAPIDATMVLVGNKSDLEDEREVSYEEGRLLAEEFGAKFVETSVKRNENIHYLANWFIKRGIEKEMEKDVISKKYHLENSKRNIKKLGLYCCTCVIFLLILFQLVKNDVSQ